MLAAKDSMPGTHWKWISVSLGLPMGVGRWGAWVSDGKYYGHASFSMRARLCHAPEHQHRFWVPASYFLD